MVKILRYLTGILCAAAMCGILLYVFGSGSMRMDSSFTSKVRAAEDLLAGIPKPEPAAEIESPEEYLLPYPQAGSLFPDMDMQYAYLILQQGLERSYLKDNAELSLENDREFVIRCWSSKTGLEVTEGLADNETRLAAWDDTVQTLWELDAILSRDIKETLGTDKSVTIQLVDDFDPHRVLLRIRDGCIEFNLFRDGTSPQYEVYEGY